MLSVTEKAQSQIKEHLEGKVKMPVRICLHNGGCAGPQLAMALDEKNANDTVFDFKEFEMIVETVFLKQAKPIAVDYFDSGFKVTSALKLEGGCSSCGSGESCGV